MKLVVIAALVSITLMSIAASSPHEAAGPGTPPSVMALVAEVRALKVANDELRAENAVLRKSLATAEGLIQELIQQHNRGADLRIQPKTPQ